MKLLYKVLIVTAVMTFIAPFIVKTNSTTYIYEKPTTEAIIVKKEVLEKPVEVKAKLRSELVKICTCESGQGTGKPQQFNVKTGEVLKGVINPKDIGMCQINLMHLPDAEKLGFDIYTEQGNIKYANWLYARDGSTPWNWSKHCWE